MKKASTTSSAAGIVTATPSERLPDMPLNPRQILAGQPTARGTILTQTPDKLVSSGYWSCEAGEFEWIFAWDEFVHLLEGEAVVTEKPHGRTHTLKAGQTGFFPCGLTTHWRIVKPVRKFFVARTDKAIG